MNEITDGLKTVIWKMTSTLAIGSVTVYALHFLVGCTVNYQLPENHTQAPQSQPKKTVNISMKDPLFWSNYKPEYKSGGEATLDQEQQKLMTLYFCITHERLNPIWFNKYYGNRDTCIGKTLRLISAPWTVSRGLEDTAIVWEKDYQFTETVGYNCSVKAADKACYEEMGYCFWELYEISL